MMKYETPTNGKDLNRICLRFNDIAHFTVVDIFSHPFLPCQCLFTFSKYNITSLWPNSKKNSSEKCEMWAKYIYRCCSSF